jgi:hypothetical protein
MLRKWEVDDDDHTAGCYGARPRMGSRGPSIMRVQRLILGLSIAAVLQSPVSGTPLTITIVDCGKWLKARDAHDASRTILETYVNGVIDGMTLGSDISIRGIGYVKYSDDQIFYWLDNYCKTNPLQIIAPGLEKFANEATNNAYAKQRINELNK